MSLWSLLHDLVWDYTLRNIALGAAILGLVGGVLGSFAVRWDAGSSMPTQLQGLSSTSGDAVIRPDAATAIKLQRTVAGGTG